MTFKSNTRIRMVFGYVAALGALSWASALLYQDSLQFRENRRWVSHTQDVLDELQKFRGSVREATSARCGYLLTGGESYLRTYASSVDEAGQNLDRFQLLAADNPRQQASVARLRPHLLAEFQEFARTIELRRAQGPPPGLGQTTRRGRVRETDQGAVSGWSGTDCRSRRRFSGRDGTQSRRSGVARNQGSSSPPGGRRPGSNLQCTICKAICFR